MDIRIKSFPNGLCVYLNESDSFEDIKTLIERKFVENRNFFGNKKLCISFSGKKLTEKEEQSLCDIIAAVTDIDIVCIVETNETEYSQMCKDLIYGKEEKSVSEDIIDYDIIGNLAKAGKQTDIIETSAFKTNLLNLDNDTVLIGNIPENVKIKSNGNLYVFGCVNGKIVLNNAENYIIALKLNPIYIKIAGFELRKNKSLLSRKESAMGKKVYFAEGKIISEDVTYEDIDYIFNR